MGNDILARRLVEDMDLDDLMDYVTDAKERELDSTPIEEIERLNKIYE